MDALNVLTGIDLPADHPGGSMILLDDLYKTPGPFAASAYTLPPTTAEAAQRFQLLDVAGRKAIDQPGHEAWAATITQALHGAIGGGDGVDIVHCQHLAFGMTPALISVLPNHPRIGLVHGTDLIYAAENPTQLAVLRASAAAMDAIVVPTNAMGDWLQRLAPATEPGKLYRIAWGVPDDLLERPFTPRPRVTGSLKVLFAGRMTQEKGAFELVEAARAVPGVELTLIGPPPADPRLTRLLTEPGIGVEHLGYLPRRELFASFARFDLLAVPSTTLEAFCLTAIEAQACGLPVLYQPVPGLNEVLGASGVAVDFTNHRRLAAVLHTLATDPTTLHTLRAAGVLNARRYPVSTTITALAQLSHAVIDARRSHPRPAALQEAARA